MRTAKPRVVIRHIFVLSFLIILGLAASGYWFWTKAESATTTEGLPALRGDEAITHLKELGLYSLLGEALNTARYNAKALPPGFGRSRINSRPMTAALTGRRSQ